MESWEKGIIESVRKSGIDLFVGADGIVHGRGKLTPEVMPWIQDIKKRNDVYAELLRAEVRQVELRTPEEVSRWGQRFKAGEIELAGEIVYSESRRTAVMNYREVFRNGV